jgi:hypothetical protein
VTFGVSPANAATTTYKAETAAEWTVVGSGWSNSTSVAGYSGTGYKRATTSLGTLNLGVTVPAGSTGVINVVAHKTTVAGRQFSWALDGGSFTTVTQPTDATGWYVALSATGLAAGFHQLSLRYVAGDQLLIDSGELVTTVDATTTTTTAPPTTTTTASVPYDGPTSDEFNEAHQDLLTAGAFAVFFIAVHVVASWRRGRTA